MMPPIQFQSADGQWIGVGSMVWVCGYRQQPKQGCVTGFNRHDEDIASVEVTLPAVNLPGGIYQRLPEVREYDFGDVLGSERASWQRYAELLAELVRNKTRSISREQKELAAMRQELSEIHEQWG